MPDLTMTPETREMRGKVRAFMDEHIYPNEEFLTEGGDDAQALMTELRAKTKAMGMWAPHLPAGTSTPAAYRRRRPAPRAPGSPGR